MPTLWQWDKYGPRRRCERRNGEAKTAASRSKRGETRIRHSQTMCHSTRPTLLAAEYGFSKLETSISRGCLVWSSSIRIRSLSLVCDLYSWHGALVTIDANGCQKTIAKRSVAIGVPLMPQKSFGCRIRKTYPARAASRVPNGICPRLHARNPTIAPRSPRPSTIVAVSWLQP